MCVHYLKRRAGIPIIDVNRFIVFAIKKTSRGSKPSLNTSHEPAGGSVVNLIAGHKLCKVPLEFGFLI